MANHEMNIKCDKCTNEYNARLHYTCPRCGAPFPVFRDMGSTDSILRRLGFKYTEYFDRDFNNYDNIKVVDFRKDLTHDCAIVYSEYHTADAPDEFELKEQTAELLVGDSSVQLLFNEVSDFLKVYTILNKYIKRF